MSNMLVNMHGGDDPQASREMRKAIRLMLIPLAIVAGFLTWTLFALGGGTSPDTQIPACSLGHGADGSHSTLAIRHVEDGIIGTYQNIASDGTNLIYSVSGTAKDGALDTMWTAAGIPLHVTGRYTSRRITLNDPDGSFNTTVFDAASLASCPH
jgi:hypothetical protein